MRFLDEKPIVTCSTSLGSNAAISIIRVSGFHSIEIFKDVFNFKKGEEIKPRYAYFRKLRSSEAVLDEVVFTFFKGPNSFTGENVLEISVHGNIFNVKKIIQFFLDSFPFRNADPGEFTYRALRNNKLSLSQVEGLDLLLNASSEVAHTQGINLLSGSLHQEYLLLREYYLDTLSSIELSIDFLDDIGEEGALRNFNEKFERLFNLVTALKNRCVHNSSSLLSPEVVLVGKTNAGKSTLFNLLTHEGRSIITDEHGTTRDYVTEIVNLDGNDFRFVDNAGFRETTSKVEKLGIEAAYKNLENGFFKVLVINPTDWSESDNSDFKDFVFDLIVFTHADVADASDIESLKIPRHQRIIFTGPIEPLKNSGPIEPLKNSGPIEPPKNSGPIEPPKNSGPTEPPKNSGPIEPSKNSGPIEPLRICAHFEVKSVIYDMISTKFKENLDLDPVLLSRHVNVISNIYSELLVFSKQDLFAGDIAVASSEFQLVSNKINELVGTLHPEEVLNNIFANFCIGK